MGTMYVYFPGCLTACLSLCLSFAVCLFAYLFVCLSVCLSAYYFLFTRIYPTMREPIILAHIPGTNRTFSIHGFTYCLSRQGNNSCFAAPGLPTYHQRILTWASNIPFNSLEEWTTFFCKAKRVPTVNSDKKPQLLIPLKKYNGRW